MENRIENLEITVDDLTRTQKKVEMFLWGGDQDLQIMPLNERMASMEAKIETIILALAGPKPLAWYFRHKPFKTTAAVVAVFLVILALAGVIEIDLPSLIKIAP